MYAHLHSTRPGRVLLLLFLAVSAVSITGAAAATPTGLEFEHITAAGGLPTNTVYWIAQDSLGFLWFSTWNGLVP